MVRPQPIKLSCNHKPQHQETGGRNWGNVLDYLLLLKWPRSQIVANAAPSEDNIGDNGPCLQFNAPSGPESVPINILSTTKHLLILPILALQWLSRNLQWRQISSHNRAGKILSLRNERLYYSKIPKDTRNLVSLSAAVYTIRQPCGETQGAFFFSVHSLFLIFGVFAIHFHCLGCT